MKLFRILCREGEPRFQPRGRSTERKRLAFVWSRLYEQRNDKKLLSHQPSLQNIVDQRLLLQHLIWVQGGSLVGSAAHDQGRRYEGRK